VRSNRAYPPFALASCPCPKKRHPEGGKKEKGEKGKEERPVPTPRISPAIVWHQRSGGGKKKKKRERVKVLQQHGQEVRMTKEEKGSAEVTKGEKGWDRRPFPLIIH